MVERTSFLGAEASFKHGGTHGTTIVQLLFDLNEAYFAFKSDQVPELLSLVSLVGADRVMAQYTAFLAKEGSDHVPTSQECEYYVSQFLDFSKELQNAVGSRLGIIWLIG